MLTLAFDTSFKTVAVAVMQDDVILCDVLVNSGLHHSETLLPSIDQALRQLKLKIEDIDFFACTLGPGSFTGLRVGVSTLKGLLLATGKPSAGVSSLASLALNVTGSEDLICPVMDAGRGQVYTAAYRYNENGLLNQTSPEIVVDPRELLQETNEKIIFVGEGAIKYRDLLLQKAKAGKIAVNGHQHIRACAVGILGREKYEQNELLDPAAFTPVYLRAVDAKLGRRLFEK